MSYAIANVIIGIPLTEEIHTALDEMEGDDSRDPEDWFEVLYTASGQFSPGYCGEKISEFTECDGDIPVGDLRFVPTKKLRELAEKKCFKLPEAIKKVARPFGVYVVWSSS